MSQCKWIMKDEWIRERYELAFGRIQEMTAENRLDEKAQSFFSGQARFIMLLDQTAGDEKLLSAEKSEQECREANELLYQDIIGEAYEKSWCNPAYAVKMLGKEIGQQLSFFASELRGGIGLIYERREEEWTALCEELLDLYQIFLQTAEGELDPQKLGNHVHQSLYYFISDYADVTVTYHARELLDPSLDFSQKILMESDLTDLRYLYRYGEWISENEKKIAAYLNSLPQEKIDQAAFTFTDGYIRGFELAGKDLSTKKTVDLRYPIGFERIMRQAVLNFRKAGLTCVSARTPGQRINRRQNIRSGVTATCPNLQYEYDHRNDEAIYMDAGFKERKLSVFRCAYEEYKEAAAAFAGPAVLETFGEDPFHPEEKEEVCVLTEKQNRLASECRSQASLLLNQYIDGETTSFTIMSLPVPEIGKNFEAVFDETMELNSLDVKEYGQIQEKLIAALDEAEIVRIKGKPGNKTDMTVALHPMTNPETESRFENCLSDVNIPLGEVFTSPQLTGTNGVLHVSDIFINDIRYLNLELHFENGRTTYASCTNFEDPEKNNRLVKDNILFRHDWLPIGEFAIGTNTKAYAMARKYDILSRMKILIVEKTGPHFAVGDTCYSYEEDLITRNPDGKILIAKDNEETLKRKTDPEKAYFNCHTDITVPYDELDTIIAVRKDGSEITLIRGGRFVLPGTEALNEPLKNIDL